MASNANAALLVGLAGVLAALVTFHQLASSLVSPLTLQAPLVL